MEEVFQDRFADVEATVARHEGYRKYMYKCPAGKTTIGYGTNLDAGLPEDEARMLLSVRLIKLADELSVRIPWWGGLSEVRQDVLINMAYQMGVEGLMGFKNALAAMGREDWATAEAEMLDSKWARSDSPNRAKELAMIMRTGSDEN